MGKRFGSSKVVSSAEEAVADIAAGSSILAGLFFLFLFFFFSFSFSFSQKTKMNFRRIWIVWNSRIIDWSIAQQKRN